LNSFEFECKSRKHQQLKSQHETQKLIQALRESMLSVAWMFIKRMNERTEKKS